MNFSSLKLKIARWLAKKSFPIKILEKYLLIKTLFWKKLLKNRVVVVLSLGREGHGYSSARALNSLGYKVLLISPDPTLAELVYSNYLLKMDPLLQTERILDEIDSSYVDGVLVSTKHLLLPAQNILSKYWGKISVGELSAETSNDKLKWRNLLEESSIHQQRYSEDYEKLKHLTLVQKPRKGTGSAGVFIVEPNNQPKELNSETLSRSVGEQVFFEEYIEGKQYDVEGVSFDGTHNALVIVHEKYEIVRDSFPPKFFNFNPILEPSVEKKMIDTTYNILSASGISTGAWHVEMRYSNGEFYPIDFANRMGYERFVSLASGVDFAQLHVSSFIDNFDHEIKLVPSKVFQFFAHSLQEDVWVRKISSEFPEYVYDVVLEEFQFAGIICLSMMVLKFEDEITMKKVLGSFYDSELS